MHHYLSDDAIINSFVETKKNYSAETNFFRQKLFSISIFSSLSCDHLWPDHSI